MNKSLLIFSASLAAAASASAQSAIDAYRIAQPDMKGTARFMSMGGAFGALGGDLSSLSQNPAGIGVYRSNDIGFTLDLDCQSASTNSQGNVVNVDQTKFLLNNLGVVLTMRLPNETFPNVNFGFTYNKGASFNRKYSGQIPRLNTSMSNYIAWVTNGERMTVDDLQVANNYDPYNPVGNIYVPWISVLGYQGYLITPSGEGENTRWFGQWDQGTSGVGSYNVIEKGSLDEYNIAIGGNISNVVYWGMNFDITNIDYTMTSRWGETLYDAYISDDIGEYKGNAMWDLNNYYNISGTGFNYQLGLILKPIQELRIGFAFHTPTWYSLTEKFGASVDYEYDNTHPDGADTNNGTLGYNDMDFRTPWKIIGSVAGVIGNQFILSLDYEWQAYNKMKYSEPGTYGGWGGGPDDIYDPWYPYYSSGPQAKTRSFEEQYDRYYNTNSDICYYYQNTHTLRIGAEYRVTPSFSLRAGYSYSTSPVKKEVRDDKEIVYTSGTLPNYRLDNHTNYVTCGFGYRYKQFYLDMAYVYKNINSTYHAFSPEVDYDTNVAYPSPQSKLSLKNNQVVLTAGFRF